MTRSPAEGCAYLLSHCARLKSSDRIMIISEEKTKDIAALMAETAAKITGQVRHSVIGLLDMHGKEPPAETAKHMKESDVICALTLKSMAHTQARLEATLAGARYLSLPDYSWELLSQEALFVDFQELTPICDRLTDLLTKGNKATIKTDKGTNLTCSIEGRIGNSAPGWCRAPGTLASPPDAECNIALLEEDSNGVLVVDGSIPYDDLGLVTTPVHMQVRDGKVISIQVEDTSMDKILQSLLFQGDHHDQKRVLAELGIGLNPKARLSGNMLMDEGTLGTVHIGLGSNATIGGKNKINFHLDLVIKLPTLEIDNQMILEKGELLCALK